MVYDCEIPFTSCVVQGDRAWPGGPGYGAALDVLGRIVRDCPAGPVTKFPLTARIVEYFDEILASTVSPD